MNVTFTHKEQLSPTLFSFYFVPERPLHYIAGQFIELTIPHSNTDERGEKRWFTLSSAPHESQLAITTHYSAQSASSYKHTLFNMSAQDTVAMSAPLGDFVVPKNPAIPVLFIASGIGVTPYRSIIADEVHRQSTRDITLVHAIHNDTQAVFNDVFNNDAISYSTLSADLLNSDTLVSNISDDHYVYLAGPETTVEKLVAELTAHHIKRSQIFTDFFHGYSSKD